MKRRTSPLPTRIWSYGCLRPTTNTDAFFDQLRKAHVYYNTLIEIERDRRAEYRKDRAKLCPDIEKFEAEFLELDKAVDLFRATMKAEKKKKDDTGELKRLKDARKAIGEKLKALRLEMKNSPELKKLQEKEKEVVSGKVRAARKSSGVYWGTYLLIEKAVETARRSKMDPRFAKWRGTGRIGIQLHHVKWSDIVDGKSQMFQVDPLPETQWDTRKGRRHAYTKARVRVGTEKSATTGKQVPVFVEVPLYLHRRPPADAKLTWAWIFVTRKGPTLRYQLQLSVESNLFSAGLPEQPKKSVCAVDVCWRKMDHGLRLGLAVDHHGNQFEMVLPKAVPELIEMGDNMKSAADRIFNGTKDFVSKWIKENGLPGAIEPARVSQWLSHRKLRGLTRQWLAETIGFERARELWRAWCFERVGSRKNPLTVPKKDLFAPAEEAFAWAEKHGLTKPFEQMAFYLELWSRKDRHLEQWAADQFYRATMIRRDAFRNWSRFLVNNYETILLEDMTHTTFAKDSVVEAEKSFDVLHRQRNEAAPGLFMQTLRSAVGAHVVPMDPADTTNDCAHCRHRNDWSQTERSKNVVLTCAGCGKMFDQDANAARTMLIRYFEGDTGSGGSKDKPKPASPPPSKPPPRALTKRRKPGAEPRASV